MKAEETFYMWYCSNCKSETTATKRPWCSNCGNATEKDPIAIFVHPSPYWKNLKEKE